MVVGACKDVVGGEYGSDLRIGGWTMVKFLSVLMAGAVSYPVERFLDNIFGFVTGIIVSTLVSIVVFVVCKNYLSDLRGD